MGLLDGRVAIVTGAGRGIGRGEAIELAREGARVVVNELDADAGQAVVDEIAAAGGEAVLDTGDCSEDDTARGLVGRAVDTFGRLDALVNNAGILRDRTVVKMSPEEWDSVIKVHLRGHYLPTHYACAHWKETGAGGRIVCTASSSGLLGNFGQANYGAAKAGIAAFSTIVAMEMARYGVRCNAIAPAARTRMTESAYGAFKDLSARGRRSDERSTSGTRTTSPRWSPTSAATPPGPSAARCSACRATRSSSTSRSRRSR